MLTVKEIFSRYNQKKPQGDNLNGAQQFFARSQNGMRNGNTPEFQTPVRVSIVTQFYPPDYAATGQLIEELTNRLANHGLHIQVFTGQPSYAFQKHSAPNVEQTPQTLIRRSRTSRLWPERIRGKALNGLLFWIRSGIHLLKASAHGDVLLLTTAPPYLPVLGYLINRLFGIPYVCLLYDLYPDVAVELNVVNAGHWVARIWNFLNRRIWQQAGGVIVLSSTMKDRIVAKCPEVADKITVIHSWADPHWIVPRPKQENWFAAQHGLQEKFTVLYSGNMGRCHDMDTILEAARRLEGAAVQFVFIGSGAKRQTFMEQVTQLGLTNCLFLPYQDKNTLPYSLTACDLSLVSIGLGMEGLIAPSKFYGSLSAGRPIAVICEPHSYLAQIIHEARCGGVFNIGDGKGLAEFISHLSHDPNLTEKMGKAGRLYLEQHFTPEIIAKQYFKTLVGTLPPGNFTESTTSAEPVPEPLPEPIIDLQPSKKMSLSQQLVKWRKSG